MKKKIFSLVLCVMLLVGLIPVKALADVDPELITEVSLTYSQPKIGASCITDLEIVSSDPADSCHILKAQWYDETAGAEVDSSDTFIAGHNYHLIVELYVDGDHEFPATQDHYYTGTVILNGQNLSTSINSSLVSVEFSTPTEKPAATSIADATLSASSSPVYTGNPVDVADFGITVTLDGTEVPADAVTMHFYTDVACSNEVVDGSENPCTPTAAGVYYVTADGVESKGYTGTAGPAQVIVKKADFKITAEKDFYVIGEDVLLTVEGAEIPDGTIVDVTTTPGKTLRIMLFNGKAMISFPAAQEGRFVYKASVASMDLSSEVTFEVGTYKIIEGNDKKIDLSQAGDALFTSNAAFSKFKEVQVDGKAIDAKNYTVKEGSTKVTLTNAYLKTLADGEHTLTIVSTDGQASTKFTITSDAPDTGDSTNPALWSLMMVGSLAAMAACLILRKKDMEY